MCIRDWRRGALRLERAVGEKARAVERDRLVEAGRGVVLDELDGTTAGEERVDRVRFLRGDLGQERLELDVRERQVQVLDDLAAALLEPFGEALRRFRAGGVVPGDRHRPLDALLA